MNLEIEKGITAHDKRRRREKGWVGIIIHHTGIGNRKSPSRKKWKELYKNITAYLAKKDKNYVSSHYTIGREGEISQIVDPETHEAYHAGKSRYWHPIKRRWCDDWNRYAIGIELIGDGNKEPYTFEQYIACARLCCELMKEHQSISPLAITGHDVIAWPRGRKDDPGVLFHWEYFFRLIYRNIGRVLP